MASKAQPLSAATRVYEDFEPNFEWAEDAGTNTLIIYLPGFRKDKLRVQVTSARVLRVSGERQLSDNLIRRFLKEWPIPTNCDANNIGARFENGILSIKHPKMITNAETSHSKPSPYPTQEAPARQQLQSVTHEGPPKPNNSKLPANGKETSETKGKSGIEAAEDNDSLVKKRKNDTMATRPKDEKQEGKIEMGKKVGAYGCEDGSGKCGLGGRYGQVACGMFNVIKKQKRMVNLGLVVLLVILLGLYVKNVMKSPVTPRSEEL